jgi:hypothetical protein
MGIDYYPTTIYGAGYTISDKLPNEYKQLIDADKAYQLPERYKGLEIFWSDAGFHGIGKRVSVKRKHEKTKESVIKIFKRLGWGKPSYIEFVELSV